MRALIVALLLVTTTASAEPWYRGKYGKNRVTHVSITVAGAAVYVSTETFLKPTLAPTMCRWCEPDSVDTSVRDALLWGNAKRAATFSNLLGYGLVPTFAIGGTLLEALFANADTAYVIDDLTPEFESIVIAELVTQAVKYGIGRQRPYAHFMTQPVSTGKGTDDNLSFFSGHSSLVFSVMTSAAVVAHRRHYPIEPYLWSMGMALAGTTAYLRIAGDKHYFTDVLTGSAVGVAAGIFVPRFMERPTPERVTLVPTGNGVMLVGAF